MLGDYEVWGTGGEGKKWSMTARSGGELLWTAGGELAGDHYQTETFVATVTSYAESDCTNDNYGKYVPGILQRVETHRLCGIKNCLPNGYFVRAWCDIAIARSTLGSVS